MIKWLKEWHKHMKMNPIERYLAEASDLADLERRQKALSRGQVRLG